MTAFGKCSLWHKPGFEHRESLSCSRDCTESHCSFPATPKRNWKCTLPTAFHAYSLLHDKLNSDFSGCSKSNYSTSSSALTRKFKIGCPYGFLLRLWPSSQALSSVPWCTCLSPLETSSSLTCSVATAPQKETGTPRHRASSGLFWAPSLELNKLHAKNTCCSPLAIKAEKLRWNQINWAHLM